jgi:hypothetical protein
MRDKATKGKMRGRGRGRQERRNRKRFQQIYSDDQCLSGLFCALFNCSFDEEANDEKKTET